ncbi:hypothetical protein SS1G_11030 [Sclerotinia sclerotiorum 1980 UF-70]|uniref:Grh/CP2 DB domain-containing protein n=1 Tax=Sclerotinia sclerotiorum (strain ATCC 18683 / 1980 / Ss-1) TaxID=665079 RepID=A7F0B3_SCLS1|nr:hypothetical protein SS1G_11030 [Sclerotinia sclerotiorum 1980 UF-70]EDN95155.1 hypothetical protein SS1G_11030 [Sclerotinia sclerotiorum 1980 UF-70]
MPDFVPGRSHTFPFTGTVVKVAEFTIQTTHVLIKRKLYEGGNSSTHSSKLLQREELGIALLSTFQMFRNRVGGEEIKDLDPTPRAQQEPWRFTPSLLDNNFTFNAFSNGTPVPFYTPTPGAANTLYHNQAGDLHTPGMGMGMGLGTPLSLPTSTDGLHAHTMMDMSHFGHHLPPHFQNFNPFAHPHHQQQTQQQTSFAPSSFVHQDTGYETMDHDGSPMDDDEGPLGTMERAMHQSPLTSFQPQSYGMSMSGPGPQTTEKFRFHVILNAPTAMIKQADEIPVTYLNKGQAYSVSVMDTGLTQPLQPGTRYRTFVRISFEDEQQRQRPASCWQLWKEGRGTNEAHQRGGKLQAVEYVESTQPGESDDKRTRVELDTASFDGFSVIWTPAPNCAPECNIAGIPVRFCAKTQTLPSGSPHVSETSEVAFCKVKLFRDHGAERKLANDIAHVRKTIDKLKQQISQAETGMKDFGKRKRGSTTKAQLSEQRPGKVQKHKRTWSMSSASSAGGRVPMEEDLHSKLRAMSEMSQAHDQVASFSCVDSEQDDPDIHPSGDAGSLSGWIEALGVDPSYNPPVIEQPVKPAACFYVLRRDTAQPGKHEYHRAIYLMQRTLKDFIDAIALKWKIEPTKIMRTLRVLDSGLQVEMDDDVVRELSEGQDFILEVQVSPTPVKREWEMDVTVDNDNAGATQNVVPSEGYELRLFF